MKYLAPLLKTSFILAIFCLGFSVNLQGKDNVITDSKTVSKTFEVNSNALFKLTGHESEMIINTWDKNTVEIKATMVVEAYEQEEIQKMLEQMKVEIEGSKEQVNVYGTVNYKNKIVMGNKTRIKTGSQTIKIKSFSYKYEIMVPKTNHINIKNVYGKVLLGSHTGRVNVVLYEGDLQASAMKPTHCQLDLKYSTALLGTLKKLDIKGYESEITFQECSEFDLDIKYCKLVANRCKDVNFNAYESDINMGITSSVNGKHSYGSLIIAEGKSVSLNTYELRVQTGDIDILNLSSSKYSKLTAGNIKNLTLTDIYENKMIFNSVGKVLGNLKYSSLDILELEGSLALTGYELSCRVANLKPEFINMTFDAKYSKLSVMLAESTKLKLNSNLAYGTLKFPSRNFDVSKSDKKDTRYLLEGQSSGYQGEGFITLKGYETNVIIDYH